MQEQMTGALPEGQPADFDTGERAPGWGWGDLLMALLTTVAGAAALTLTARSVVASLGLEVEERLVSPAFYLVGLGVYLAAVLGVYLFAARRAGWAALGLRPFGGRVAALIPLTFVLGISSLIFVNLLVTLIQGGFENPQVDALTGGQALSTGELLMLLLLVAGVVPFAEELFFRGMLYPLLRARLGPVLAVVINAAVFAAAHFIPLLLPGLFVVGLLMAYLRERSGSIWPSVIFHSMQNGLALLSIAAALSQGAL